MGILKYPDRTAGRFQEKAIVVDLSRALQSLAQFKLSSHDVQGPWAQCDPPILSSLCRSLSTPAPDVEIGHEESDLLGRAHPGEEPELIVIALRLAPDAHAHGADSSPSAFSANWGDSVRRRT
jgi:hypothetical protein